MKKLIVLFSLLSATMGYAVCPDLTGAYLCKEKGGDNEIEITISQSTDETGTTFSMSTMDPFLIDDKLEVQSVIVPGCWGGTILFQKICEENAVVLRTGLGVQILTEMHLSKNKDGVLAVESYDMEKSDTEKLKPLFEPIYKEWQQLEDSLRVSEEQMNEAIRKFATEKSIPAWKKAIKQGLIEKSELECRKS